MSCVLTALILALGVNCVAQPVPCTRWTLPSQPKLPKGAHRRHAPDLSGVYEKFPDSPRALASGCSKRNAALHAFLNDLAALIEKKILPTQNAILALMAKHSALLKRQDGSLHWQSEESILYAQGIYTTVGVLIVDASVQTLSALDTDLQFYNKCFGPEALIVHRINDITLKELRVAPDNSIWRMVCVDHRRTQLDIWFHRQHVGIAEFTTATGTDNEVAAVTIKIPLCTGTEKAKTVIIDLSAIPQ